MAAMNMNALVNQRILNVQHSTLTHTIQEKVYKWISDLAKQNTKENALLELSKNRKAIPELACLLWHSFGTIAVLLHEVMDIYPYFSCQPTLTAHQADRVCNALTLLQCVASHPETRPAFLQAATPFYFLPFLYTDCKTQRFKYLRLRSLGVIAALVKTYEQDVINFLISTKFIRLCLRIMETGGKHSKTAATFILQRFLLNENGLNYICDTYERFSEVAISLDKVVLFLSEKQLAQLLEFVILCYLRLSDNPRARAALHECLPNQLKDRTFSECLKKDESTKYCLSQLLKNLEVAIVSEECLS